MPVMRLSRLRTCLLVCAATVGTQAVATPLCVAHRGNSSEELENSLASLGSAVDIGAHAVEFDIRHTRDGIPILLHDKTLNRTARGRIARECPYGRDVATLDFATIQEKCRLKNGEDVPTLEDALDVLQHRRPVRRLSGYPLVMLELKDVPRRSTLDLVAARFAGRAGELLIISFSEEALDSAAAHAGIAALRRQGTPLLHIASDRDDLSLAYEGVCIRKPDGDTIAWLQDESQKISVWTVDDRSEMQHYLGTAIDYLVSNKPAMCLSLRD